MAFLKYVCTIPLENISRNPSLPFLTTVFAQFTGKTVHYNINVNTKNNNKRTVQSYEKLCS